MCNCTMHVSIPARACMQTDGETDYGKSTYPLLVCLFERKFKEGDIALYEALWSSYLFLRRVVSIQKSIDHTYQDRTIPQNMFQDNTCSTGYTNDKCSTYLHRIWHWPQDDRWMLQNRTCDDVWLHNNQANTIEYNQIHICRGTGKRGGDMLVCTCIFQHSFACLHMYVFLLICVTPVISYPSNAFAPARKFQCTLLHSLCIPTFSHFLASPRATCTHIICLIWFTAPLSNTFNGVNTCCIKLHAHPVLHLWLRCVQSLAEFCSYTCCSHSCAYILRYSGKSIGQLASGSAGVGRTWLSKHCLVYSMWCFAYIFNHIYIHDVYICLFTMCIYIWLNMINMCWIMLDQIMLEYIGVPCLQNVVVWISLWLYSSEDEFYYWVRREWPDCGFPFSFGLPGMNCLCNLRNLLIL